jgi:hypothetical protein
MRYEKKGRIRELERQIADIKSRMPAHSVKPAMLQQLEDLEEELEKLKEIEKEVK